MASRFCELCGTEYDGGRAACPRCGDGSHAPAVAAESNGRAVGHKMAAGAVLAVIAVIAVIALPRGDRRGRAGSDDRPAAPIERTALAPGGLEAVAPLDPAGVPPGERPFLDELDRGQVAYDAGRFEDALAEYLRALELDPQNAQAANDAGLTLVRLARFQEAATHLQQAVEAAPGRWDFRFNFGRALARAGRWEDAAREYREAATLRPDDYPTAFNLAQALERTGQDDEALAEYRRGTELAPLEPSFRLAIGALCERRRRWADARKAFEEYLEVAPDGGEAVKVRKRLAELDTRAGAATAAVSGEGARPPSDPLP